MSEKNEKRGIVIISAIVALLIFALLIVLLRGQGETPVYRISVVTDGMAEEYWKQFRRGVDQATLDYSVDVHFLIPSGDDPAAQQLELLAREIEAGADAIILSPIDADRVKQWLEDTPPGCPVITVGCTVESGRQAAFVGVDNAAFGEALATAAMASGGEIWAVYTYPMSTAVAQRYETFRATAEQAGRSVTAMPLTDITFDPAKAERAVVAALDPQTAEDAVARMRKAGIVWPVYGIGCTNVLIGELEHGSVHALVVQSDYDVGYIAIQAAVAALNEERLRLAPAAVYTATAENMFDDQTARVLVPMS